MKNENKQRFFRASEKDAVTLVKEAYDKNRESGFTPKVQKPIEARGDTVGFADINYFLPFAVCNSQITPETNVRNAQWIATALNMHDEMIDLLESLEFYFMRRCVHPDTVKDDTLEAVAKVQKILMEYEKVKEKC